MSDLKDKIEELKQLRIQEILSWNSSKIEKLYVLEQEQLFTYHPFIFDPFPDEWEEEFREKLNCQHCIIDCFIHDGHRRYTLVSFVDILENLPKEGEVVVYTCREPEITYAKPVDEVIDAIYDYCIEYQEIGFEYDW